MATSLYYTADRAEPLTEEESAAIDDVLERYTIEALMEYLGRDEPEESLWFEADSEHLLEGTTRLPGDCSFDQMLGALDYWLRALSEVRLAVTGAEWDVHVDEMEVPWDAAQQRFALPAEPESEDFVDLS